MSKPHINYPDTETAIALVKKYGTITKAAKQIGTVAGPMINYYKRRGVNLSDFLDYKTKPKKEPIVETTTIQPKKPQKKIFPELKCNPNLKLRPHLTLVNRED